MTTKFSDLQLEPRLNSAIEKLGYQEMTPIQSAVIPLVLAGRDVSGLAQTGTGKTAAFLIPLMDRILKNQFVDWKASQFVLILVPTRELAEQVFENVVKLSEVSGLRGVAVYGGTGYDKQKEAFRNQVEFVVATPGRLIDLYKEHFVDLKQVRAIVFDEADRMFDMGFKDDMKYILQRVPKERQFLVFSATLNFDVLNTAYQFGAEPVEVDVSRDQARAENVKDEIFHVGQEDKPMYLLSLLKKHNPKQAIIFSNFKNSVERIANFLSANGLPAMAISSLLTQSQRNRVLELFKAENEKNILVATDVAARGLDIKGVDMVINFELPMDAESYVHRIGRTGRAGAEGQAFSLVSDRDVDSLARIEEYLKHKLNTGWLEDADMVRDHKPIPREEYRRRAPEGGPRRGGGDGRRDGRPPMRGGDSRGPRREGSSGSSEGRSDGPRRPYRDRNDRPPRAAGAAGENPQAERGPRPAHPQGQHNSRGGSGGGARASEQRPRAAGGGGAGQPSQRPRHHDRAKPTGDKTQAQHANGRKPHSGQTNRAGGAKPAHARAAGPKTPMQKVTGFFKKIFGD